MRLSINFGSRGRPEHLVKTITQVMPMVSRDDTRVLVCIDDDDQPSIDAIKLLPKDDRIAVSVKPREDSRGAKIDRALTEAPADLYMTGHDMAPIFTPAFDQKVINAARVFEDGIGVVLGPMANTNFPSAQIVTQGWVDLVGHIYCHDYPFWFIDHELDDLCRMTGRYVFTDIKIGTELAFRPRKTTRLRDLVFWMDYYDMARFRRRATANKIINAIDIPDAEKMIRATWYEMVEKRSLDLHANLRKQAAIIEFGWHDREGNFHEGSGEGGEPDPGYVRAFEKARLAMIEMEKEVHGLREAA